MCRNEVAFGDMLFVPSCVKMCQLSIRREGIPKRSLRDRITGLLRSGFAKRERLRGEQALDMWPVAGSNFWAERFVAKDWSNCSTASRMLSNFTDKIRVRTFFFNP